MKPTRDELETRDLVEPALRIARAHGLTLEGMFAERSGAAPRARSVFYVLLVGMGWTRAAIGRFVGKDHKCICTALDKYGPGEDAAQ